MSRGEGQGACQALGKGVYSLVISLLRFVVLALARALSLTANAAGAGSRCPWQRPGSAPRRFFWREGCIERRCEYSKAVGSHGQPTAFCAEQFGDNACAPFNASPPLPSAAWRRRAWPRFCWRSCTASGALHNAIWYVNRQGRRAYARPHRSYSSILSVLYTM